MSKLSDAVAELSATKEISNLTWNAICQQAADDILNLDFNIKANNNVVTLLCNRKYKDYSIKVEIQPNAKTTAYIITVEDDKNAQTYTVSNLKGTEEYVDIGELKTYIASKVELSEKARTKKLHEEIDKGFRKQDSRAPLGGETLENDIAFNEYLHNKIYRK